MLSFACVFVPHPTKATGIDLIPEMISPPDARPTEGYLRYGWHHICFNCFGKRASSVMSRLRASLAEIKMIYYTSIKQRERIYFRQLNFRKPRL